MADNNTASPGYLQPAAPLLPYDDALADLLQPIFVGLSGLPGTLVRPRWQIGNVPNQPEPNVNWMALGIARWRPDRFAYTEHHDEGAGYDLLERSEEHDVLCSFYGPLGSTLAMMVSDNLQLENNRAPLQDLKMDLLQCGDPVQLPSLLHGVWQKRCDMTVTLRRWVQRTYGVLTIVALPDAGPTQLGLNNEKWVEPIVVDPPESQQ